MRDPFKDRARQNAGMGFQRPGKLTTRGDEPVGVRKAAWHKARPARNGTEERNP